MKGIKNINPDCPLNREQCPVLDQLLDLQRECRRLQELSQTDTLTGFYNFRYLVQALGDEMERTRRTGLPTGLIMIDLDHFKRINDTFGHDMGNRALKWCASVWRKNIRRIDIPCRYGGEEFAIILPSTRLAQAVRAAERLRDAIARMPFMLDDTHVTLTASFGVDVYTRKDNLGIEEFISRADSFLLNAKETGRNRVRYAGEGTEPASTELTPEERRALFPPHEDS